MSASPDAGAKPPAKLTSSLRILVAIYGTSFFSLSTVPMAAVIVSLWAVHLGASPLWIGIAVSARSLLPMLLSIHGGVLMDRLGTRRVMLFFSVITLVTFPLYPYMPWIGALILLQLVTGLTQGLTWVGSQTLYGQLARGSVKHAGWVTFFTNAGSFAGPLLGGVLWDHVGIVGAFAALSGWSLATLILVMILPRDIDPPAKPLRASDLIPRGSDYVRAFALCAIPVIALVMIFTFMRIAVFGLQSSFYVVYLQEIGMSGTLIGTLVACANLISGPAALINLPERIIKPVWLMLIGSGTAVICMAITPLMTNFWLLMLFGAGYGVSMGLCFPTLLSLLSNAVSPQQQGMSVGLRTTVNRVSSLVVPLIMGASIELVGTRASFLLVGVVLMLAVFLTALYVWRNPNAYSEGSSLER
ncbi:MAG TPA: MFS transporter [Alphaproteobacteria bacterium]|jgi:MFS family permease